MHIILKCNGKLFPQRISVQFKTLFSDAALGVNDFKDYQEKSLKEVGKSAKDLKERLNTVIASENKYIYPDSLKSWIHICKNEDSDLKLACTAMKKFHSQDQNKMFNSYSFGPPIMRMLHNYRKPNEALNAYRDCDGLFDQISSHFVLMDLLYKSGEYDEVFNLMEILKKKSLVGEKLPMNSVTLTFAALYKINTLDSFNKSMDLAKFSEEIGKPLSMHSTKFAATLALNQNQPRKALDIIEQCTRTTSYTLVNIKIIAHAELSKPQNCFPHMRNFLERSLDIIRSYGQKDDTLRHKLLKETFDSVEDSIRKIDDSEKIMSEFNTIKEEFVKNNLIDNKSLEEAICATIERHISTGVKKPKFRFTNTREELEAAFNRRPSRNKLI